MRKIGLSISLHFHNKDNRAPMRPDKRTGKDNNAYAYGLFETVYWTPQQITTHVTSGKAICVAALAGSWRKAEAFKSAQLIGIDFDDGDCDIDTLVKDDLIRQYGYLLYRTPSYTLEAPRTRAMFILDEPVTDQSVYKKLVKRLLWHFKSADDLKDGVRIFYGSDVQGHRVVHDRVFPLAVLEGLPIHPDELPPPPPPTGVKLEGDHLKAYTQAAVQREIDTLVSTRYHRNNALTRAAFNLGTLAGGHWTGLPEAEAEALLYAAACSNGYVSKDGESAARATIRSGLRAGMGHPRPEPASRPAPAVNGSARTPDSALANGHNALQITVPPPFDPLAYVRKGTDLIARYKERVSAQGAAPDFAPMAMPFAELHEFGGYARVITPGKLVGVVGNTGGGKTIMMESIVDELRRSGEDVLVFSPEWTGDEQIDRLARRYDAPNLEQVYLHMAWKAARAAGVSAGVPLSETQQRDALAAIDHVIQWEGELFTLDKARITLSQLLTTIEAVVTSTREQGYNIRNVVVDYAQILELNENGRARSLNDAVNEIKAMCIDCRLVGWIVSQVTKQDSREALGGAKDLDAYSAQWLRMDAFNFAMTLKIDKNELGIPTGTGTVKIVKNSIGRTGEKKLCLNLERGVWLDVDPSSHVAM